MAGTSNYPGALDTWVDKVDGVDSNHADDVNDAHARINAVQAELGTNPSGSAATVAARLTTIEGSLGGGGAVSSVVGQTGAVTGSQILADTAVAAALAAKLSTAAASSTYAPLAATWVTGAAYVVGQLVINAGVLYRCTTAHTAGASFAAGNFTALTSGGTASGQTTFSAAGDLTVRTGTTKWPAPRALTITGVYLAVGTAPTGAAIVCDVNVNGTTVFTTQTNRPQVAAAATGGNSTTVEAGTVTAGQVISVDIDQVGSTLPGSDLTVVVAWA